MNRLKELRTKRGITQDELGKLLGVQKAAICKYETGRVGMPNSVIMRLAEYFHVSADYLLCMDDVVPIIKSAPVVGASTRNADISSALIPLVGAVHAGLPMLADENISEYIPVSSCTVSSPDEHFFMRVEGDCMTGDHIVEGSLVLVERCPALANNAIGVVRIGDEVLLRHVQLFDGHIALIPSNPTYAPLIVSEGDVEIIGRVIEARIHF